MMRTPKKTMYVKNEETNVIEKPRSFLSPTQPVYYLHKTPGRETTHVTEKNKTSPAGKIGRHREENDGRDYIL